MSAHVPYAPQPLDLPERVQIGSLEVDPVDPRALMARIKQAVVDAGPPMHVVTANMQFMTTAARDPEFARVVQGASTVVPDGRPLLWLARLQGHPPLHRLTGHDLVHLCSAWAATEDRSVGLLGAGEHIAEAAAERLTATYPGLRIAGNFQGTFGPDGAGPSREAEDALTERIRAAAPDFLFVALGCPKQEFWIARNQTRLGVPVCIGIGSVFDVLAGRFKRAPEWMQRVGLEWTYRLGQEPGRLWRRYLLDDLPLFGRAAAQGLRERVGSRGQSQ